MATKSITTVPLPTTSQVDLYLAAKKALQQAQEGLALAQAPLTAAVDAHPSLERLEASDGTFLTVIRPQLRLLDTNLLKSRLKVSIWKLVTTTSVSLTAIDGLAKTGGIDAGLLAEATTYVDGKPYLKQG